MARVYNNLITQGLSGKIGDIVFRTRHGKTFASAAPTRNKNRVLSSSEILFQDNFKKYVHYAKNAIKDEKSREAYKKAATPGQSAYNVAFADAAHGPEVKNISHEKETGKFNNTLIIEAKDNFKVVDVTVSIFDKSGKLLESGKAEYSSINYWKYVIQGAAAQKAGIRVIATAIDLPGNEGIKELIL